MEVNDINYNLKIILDFVSSERTHLSVGYGVTIILKTKLTVCWVNAYVTSPIMLMVALDVLVGAYIFYDIFQFVNMQ